LIGQLRESLVEWLIESGARVVDAKTPGAPGERVSLVDKGRVLILPADDYTPADDAEVARVKQWRDAAVMLRELFMLEHQCAAETPNLAFIVRSAVNLGMRFERLRIRPFERLVGIGGEQVAKGATMRAARKQTAAEDRAMKHAEAVQAMADAAYKHPSLADQREVIKARAAAELGVSVRTLERRLQQSSDTT